MCAINVPHTLPSNTPCVYTKNVRMCAINDPPSLPHFQRRLVFIQNNGRMCAINNRNYSAILATLQITLYALGV